MEPQRNCPYVAPVILNSMLLAVSLLHGRDSSTLTCPKVFLSNQTPSGDFLNCSFVTGLIGKNASVHFFMQDYARWHSCEFVLGAKTFDPSLRPPGDPQACFKPCHHPLFPTTQGVLMFVVHTVTPPGHPGALDCLLCVIGIVSFPVQCHAQRAPWLQLVKDTAACFQ